MATPAETLVLKRIPEPTMELALSAQQIGHEAWLNQFGAHRTWAEITNMYDPGLDPTIPTENSERLLALMRQKAKIGTFSGIVALQGSKEIGYAWAADDMSGGGWERFYKKHVVGRRPYAWVAQINVLPKAQEQGIGSAMLLEVLEPFEPYQRPTAYVFDENPEALAWFEHRGFSRSEPKPIDKYDYFGPDAEPAKQWRLEASSVEDVQERIQRSGKLPSINAPLEPDI